MCHENLSPNLEKQWQNQNFQLNIIFLHCIHAISIVELIEGTEIHDKAVEPGVWSKTINCIDFMRLCSITNSSIWKQFKALLIIRMGSCMQEMAGELMQVALIQLWREDSIVKQSFNAIGSNWMHIAHCTLCIKCCAYNYPMSINISYGST